MLFRFDRTIERNYIQKWRFLIAEYEEVKAGHSQKFARVGEFYRHHGTCSQTFRKYCNRYLRSGAEADLLPQRRDVAARLAAIPEAEERVIVATGRYLGEGFDDSRLDTLFLTMPIAGKALSPSMPASCIVSTTPSAR